MKRLAMWLLLMTKRLLKKPSFVIILVLLPVILLMYRFIITQDDGTLRAAVYVAEGGDGLAAEVADGLENSDNMVQFYKTDSEDDLYSDVIAGRAEVGYVLPADLGHRFLSGKWSGSVIMVVSQTSQYAAFVNEFVTMELYQDYMEDTVTDYLVNKSGLELREDTVRPMVRSRLREVDGQESLFTITYRDSYTNEELSEEEVVTENYLMKPIRGTVALFVLLAGLAGLVFWFQDDAEGRFKVMSYERRPVINYGSLFLPTILGGIVGFVCIMIAGLSTGFFREVLIMLLYCIFIVGVCEIIRTLVPNVNAVCAIIPILAIGSYLCCPIIMDLKKTLPVIVYLRKILPPDYYLQVFNGRPVWMLLVAAAVVSVASFGAELLKRRR